MYGYDKFEEHMRDSAPDNSRFDGFDRGDLDNPYADDVGNDDPPDALAALRALYELARVAGWHLRSETAVAMDDAKRAIANVPVVPLQPVDFDEDISF